jgi:Tol biopolymer transport system component
MLSNWRLRGSALAAIAGLLILLILLVSLASSQAALPVIDASPGPPAERLAYVTGTIHSSSAVWVANADGSQPKRLGVGGDPLLSPSGQLVAASLFGATLNSEEGPALAVYSTAGAPSSEYLSLVTATATPLAWSPDSRYLAVSLMSTAVSNMAKQSGLAVIDTQRGTVTMIMHGAISGASFAPDGSDRLVFARAPSLAVNAPTNIYVSQPNGAAISELSHDGRSLNPVWGASYIAYDRERLRRNDAPVYQIWLLAPSGGGARRLTNVHVRSLVVGLVPLAFSSDGSRLLAEYGGQDTSEAWAVRVPSGGAKRLTVRGQSVVGAGLSRDGSTVLIDEQGFEGPPSSGRVARMPFTGGRPSVLVAHGSQGSWNR